MHVPPMRLVVAGLALAGLAVIANGIDTWVNWQVLPFAGMQALTGIGLMVMAVAVMRGASGTEVGSVLALGAVAAAAGRVWTFSEVLGFSGGFYILGEAALMLGFVQFAWYALKTGLAGSDLAAGLQRAAWPLAISAVVGAVGSLVHLALAVIDGFWVFAGTSAVVMLGLTLAAVGWAKAARAAGATGATRTAQATSAAADGATRDAAGTPPVDAVAVSAPSKPAGADDAA